MSDIYALKYRPKKISDLIGQEQVSRVLENSIKSGDLHHAYIFAGNYGCGKTSAARIFAASMNDPSGVTLEPNIGSNMVQSIFEGKHIDVTEIDAAAYGKIEEVRELKNEIMRSPIEGRFRFVILDECLLGNSRIDTEVGRIPISTIVNNKLTPKIKSYNFNSNKIEYKNITGWFKNSGKEIYKVSFEGRGAVYASEGHLFSTPDGYVPLKDLRLNSRVHRIGKSLTTVQKQLILGSLLGDMTIQRNSSKSQKWKDDRKYKACRCRIRMVHGESQFDYLEFKKNVLQSTLSIENRRDFLHSGFEGYNKKPMRSYSSKTSSVFSDIFELTIDKTGKPRKKVSEKWLNNIGLLGLAIWFCDDASVSKNKTKSGISPNVTFHTQGFTKTENEIISRWFNKKGYETSVVSSGVKNNGKHLWMVCVSVCGSKKLIRDISPYIPESMRYKIKGIDDVCQFDKTLYESNEKQSNVITELVSSIKSMGYRDTTYDIEVEDNHNYFCSDTLVHNCHRLSGAAAEAALKMIEEPPQDTVFVLCTTDPQKILPTINSRCMTLRFSKVARDLIFKHLKNVADKEGLDYEDIALKVAAIKSQGSVRNSLQNLQMISTFAASEKMTKEVALKALAAVDERYYYDLVDGILKPDAGECMRTIITLLEDGRNVGEVLDGLVDHLRNLMIISTCTSTDRLIFLAGDEKRLLMHQRDKMPSGSHRIELITSMIELVAEVNRGVTLNMNPQTMLENFVVKSITLNAALKKRSQKD